MKKIILLPLLLLCTAAVLQACNWNIDTGITTSAESYIYDSSGASSQTDTSETATAVTDVSTEAVTDAPDTAPSSAVTQTDALPQSSAPSSAAPEVTSSAVNYQEYTDSTSEVDLSISMPKANGTMHVDKSPSNKFISVVTSQKKIAAELLVAVYSLPDTGQNYVFEFNGTLNTDGTVKKTEDTLRRVYLINDKGNIANISAADSSEKVGVNSTENWFCMNVLIKGVIFPAVKDQL